MMLNQMQSRRSSIARYWQCRRKQRIPQKLLQGFLGGLQGDGNLENLQSRQARFGISYKKLMKFKHTNIQQGNSPFFILALIKNDHSHSPWPQYSQYPIKYKSYNHINMPQLLTPSVLLPIILLLFLYLSGIKGLIGILVLVLGIMGIIYTQQNRLLYMPVVPGMSKSPSQNPHRMRHPSQQNLTSIDVQLNTSDGVNIRGWHILAAKKTERIIVYFHQNAGNIGTRLFYVKQMMKRTNSDVIMVAYRGYSDSEGQPTEEGLKRDSEAVLEYATNYGKKNNLDVYVLGRSLGGAVSINIAAHPLYSSLIKGLILQNTFTSIGEMIDVVMPVFKYVKFLQTNHWKSIDKIGDIRQPILFIKSMQDELVPPSHMHKLQQQARSSSLIEEYQIATGTHNSSWDQDPEKYFSRLYGFFQKTDPESEKIIS